MTFVFVVVERIHHTLTRGSMNSSLLFVSYLKLNRFAASADVGPSWKKRSRKYNSELTEKSFVKNDCAIL